MTREKLLSLSKYVVDMQNKLDSIIPEKHKHRVEEYKEFLRREIRIHKMKLDEEKMQGK